MQRSAICATLALLLCVPALADAATETNLDGVTGVLTTPTAEVIEEGSVAFTMGRYISRALSSRGDTLVRTYAATVGYLPDLEITARIADYPLIPDVGNDLPNLQDRSVSAKYRFRAGDDWSFAAGAMDIGGESQQQDTFYGVATYHPDDDLQVSAGIGTDLLEGPFGSAKLDVGERLSLMAEYDTETVNYGLELRPLKGLALKAGIVNDDTAYSGSYSFPLDPRGRETPCCEVHIARCETAYADPCEHAAAVRDALVAESFENVLVGVNEDTLYVEFENRRFREEADALAVATIVAAKCSGQGITHVVVSPKVEDVPQLTLSVRVDDLITYLADPCQGPGVFNVTSYDGPLCPPGTSFAEEGNKKNWHGEVQIRPTQNVVVATSGEPTWRTSLGLGLAEEIYVGRGLKLQGRQEWALFNDIDEQTDPLNRDEFLQYNDSWDKDFFVLGTAGYYGSGRTGFTADAGWYTDEHWKLGGRYGFISDANNDADSEDGLALADLSYFTPELDWELNALAGTFQEGDKGVRVESRRYFGPTELTFFAYDTDQSAPHGGFRVFVPLPWFGERRHGAWKVDSAPYFGYQYRTDADPWGQLPLTGIDLESSRQRLRPEYVRQHLDNFRRAALLYIGEN